ncbi:MAG: nonstructural protein [Microviridae sp.]|nr:MAG: nonstructural protein [Microviridae sp.]
MIYKVFSIYDSKVGTFSSPICYRTIGQAERSFRDLLSQECDLSKHPEDYTMFHLADWNPENGMYFLNDAPISILTAISCVES